MSVECARYAPCIQHAGSSNCWGEDSRKTMIPPIIPIGGTWLLTGRCSGVIGAITSLVRSESQSENDRSHPELCRLFSTGRARPSECSLDRYHTRATECETERAEREYVSLFKLLWQQGEDTRGHTTEFVFLTSAAVESR